MMNIEHPPAIEIYIRDEIFPYVLAINPLYRQLRIESLLCNAIELYVARNYISVEECRYMMFRFYDKSEDCLKLFN